MTVDRALLAGAALALVLGVAGWLLFARGRSFDSPGERMYFTARNEAGDPIAYSGVTAPMMGSLSCASCHGPDARGGTRRLHMSLVSAPDIRWSTLAGDHGHAGDADCYDLGASGSPSSRDATPTAARATR
ncbi:MAG: hypothetical protein FJZ92_13425 [Chloroflexi bacterium]|nr:hypothetical protein [Chloroflexota bacterium]